MFGGAVGTSKINYYILIGGKRYDFGSSNWCYFNINGVATDYFYLCAEVLTSAYLASSSSGASAVYANLEITDFSFNVIQQTGLSNNDDQAIYDSIQGTNGLLSGFIQQAHTDVLSIIESIETGCSAIVSKITAAISSNSQKEIDNANQNTQSQINASNQNSQAQIDAAEENTNQITNGYDSSGIDNAGNVFDQGAGDLNDIEEDLSESSSQYIDNYADTAFDTSFLNTIAPSLNFVVTWFTNFWQIGGGLTATYTISFAIFIAFYIIRVRA